MADHDQGPEYKVFVGGISWQMDDAGLMKEFEDHGATKAEIMMDKMTNRSRGFGFVWFQSRAGMEDAIRAKHNSDLEGRRISVKEAIPQEQIPPEQRGRDRYKATARYGDSRYDSYRSGYDSRSGYDRSGYGGYDSRSYDSRGYGGGYGGGYSDYYRDPYYGGGYDSRGYGGYDSRGYGGGGYGAGGYDTRGYGGGGGGGGGGGSSGYGPDRGSARGYGSAPPRLFGVLEADVGTAVALWLRSCQVEWVEFVWPAAARTKHIWCGGAVDPADMEVVVAVAVAVVELYFTCSHQMLACMFVVVPVVVASPVWSGLAGRFPSLISRRRQVSAAGSSVFRQLSGSWLDVAFGISCFP
eukprot:gene2422-2727_t